ncbi:hypothetical protein V9T40_007840 [Parthenolecanium corni]|uniref:Lipase domain-containing protein n=1 Tax=Parthenolecanium corni TaxID=536013 RepID=A0AAN9TKL5_9HEMI
MPFVDIKKKNVTYTIHAVTTVQPDLNLLADQVKLHLYISPNRTTPDQVFSINDTDNWKTSNSEGKNSVAFIIHGFHGAAYEPMFQNIKNAYLSKANWTVIMVDWEKPSRVARYETAVNSALIIASLLAKWISTALVNGYVDASRMHIVGFSMGAHIAGNVGKRVTGGKVAKIFALDPALPIYDKKNITERLHIDDAEFVEVIHTCGNFISFDADLGHVDFYPNGGQFPQPGCLDPRQSTQDVWGLEIITVMVCSHNIALKYFAESIYDEHKFTAVRCDSWREFQTNNCSSTTAPMGYGTTIE